MKKPKESEIQRSIIDWLRWKGYFCHKMPSVGTYKVKTGHFIPSPNKGAPDIMAYKKSNLGAIAIAIEVKRDEKSKQTESQRQWQEDFSTKANGLYILATSIGDVDNVLKSLL